MALTCSRSQAQPSALSREQRDAAADIRRWRSQARTSPFYLLNGFAGVGKTTVVTALRHELRGPINFVAPTGKAAAVLRRKGAANATTIHRLLYNPPTVVTGDDGNKELLWETKDEAPAAGLIIADECSQIDCRLGNDLLALGVPLLITGDPFQLPPINGEPFFNGEPDFILTEIHRQAHDSQPLETAVNVHNGETIRPVKFDLDLLLAADIVIVALHETRRRINRMWRRAHGITDRYPVIGDQILCFKTNYERNVLNGELWTVADCRDENELLELQLVDDLGTETEVIVPEKDFLNGPPKFQRQDSLDSFDFGRAITAHKAQGSEWPHVVVIDETNSPQFRYMARNSGLHANEFTARWLYTSITRAAVRVDVMEPPR